MRTANNDAGSRGVHIVIGILKPARIQRYITYIIRPIKTLSDKDIEDISYDDMQYRTHSDARMNIGVYEYCRTYPDVIRCNRTIPA